MHLESRVPFHVDDHPTSKSSSDLELRFTGADKSLPLPSPLSSEFSRCESDEPDALIIGPRRNPANPNFLPDIFMQIKDVP